MIFLLFMFDNVIEVNTFPVHRQSFFIYDMDDFTRQFYRWTCNCKDKRNKNVSDDKNKMTKMLSREVMGEEHLEAVPVDKLPPPKVPLQVASHHCQSSDNCAPQKIISPLHKTNHRLPNTRVLLWEVWMTLFKIASLLLQNRFLTIDIEDIISASSPSPKQNCLSLVPEHFC